jgi:hypothetical protein
MTTRFITKKECKISFILETDYARNRHGTDCEKEDDGMILQRAEIRDR